MALHLEAFKTLNTKHLGDILINSCLKIKNFQNFLQINFPEQAKLELTQLTLTPSYKSQHQGLHGEIFYKNTWKW